MKNLFSKAAVATTALSLSALSFAQTVGTDYSSLTDAVDFSAITTVLLGVAALVIGFVLVRNNIGIIKRFISSNAK